MLAEAANTYLTLLNYSYNFVLGKKGQLVNIHLCFYEHNFYHLAGLHKLKDIYPLLSVPREQGITTIVNRAIESNYEKSCFYSIIAPRLEILCELEHLLDSDLLAFRFCKNLAHSNIDASFLLESKQPLEALLYMKDIGTENKYIFSSITTNDGKSRRLPKYKILHKEKLPSFQGAI